MDHVINMSQWYAVIEKKKKILQNICLRICKWSVISMSRKVIIMLYPEECSLVLNAVPDLEHCAFRKTK